MGLEIQVLKQIMHVNKYILQNCSKENAKKNVFKPVHLKEYIKNKNSEHIFDKKLI
jgi:hypothetical protein